MSTLRSRHADNDNGNSNNSSNNNHSNDHSPRNGFSSHSSPLSSPSAAAAPAVTFKRATQPSANTPSNASALRSAPASSSSSSRSASSSSRSSSRSSSSSSSATSSEGGFPVEFFFLFLMLMLVTGTSYFMFFHPSSPFMQSSSPSTHSHHHHHHGRPAVEDTTFTLRISLEAAYGGHTVKAPFPGGKQIICPVCNGLGGAPEDVHECELCGGRGAQVFRQQFMGMIQQVQRQCPRCGGEGKIIDNACKRCGGRGVLRQHGDIEVPLPRGVPEGHVFTIAGAGHQLAGYDAGDVHIQLSTVPHGIFTRTGDDLHVTLTLTLREALLGFTREFRHLDGRRVRVERAAVTPHDAVVTMEEEGMPVFGSERKRGWMQRMMTAVIGEKSGEEYEGQSTMEYGKLFVHFQVEFPSEITEAQRQEFRRLLKTT